MSGRLSIWVFGPVGSGKSYVLARATPEHFHVVSQDAEFERHLHESGLPLNTRYYGEEQSQQFGSLRAMTAHTIWSHVPALRDRGENLAFETTGNKPHLFRAEVEAGHRHGYNTLACALRIPLETCLARNASRHRILPEDVVSATWHVFEQALAEGTYREIFTRDRLQICSSAQEAIQATEDWLREKGAHSY
jgi:predicted kinase